MKLLKCLAFARQKRLLVAQWWKVLEVIVTILLEIDVDNVNELGMGDFMSVIKLRRSS